MIQATGCHPMSLRTLLNEMEQREAPDDSLILEPYTYIASNAGKNFPRAPHRGVQRVAASPGDDTRGYQEHNQHPAHRELDARVRGSTTSRTTSQLRRGQPVAHKIYGVPQTINAANYMYFLAFQELTRIETPPEGGLKPLYDILTSELVHLHRGQGLEILWRDSLQCPTEEEYISMVNNKTGGLLRIGIRLMMACATTNRGVDYIALTNMIGITFQIRDDLLNLQNSVYEVNKGFAEDLTEGKFSFPIIHSIRSNFDNRQVLNVLSQRPTTPTLKTHAISYMKTHTRSFEYTNRVLDQFQSEIIGELERLGGNESLRKLVDQFHAMARLPN
ncbi:hypothetical protein MKEN_01266300 [Mycena kentingensis (nom. inval.)]|nr:hypothetical protein MKEN_01266300 [Mycena kentingensis (nom. inval.)]